MKTKLDKFIFGTIIALLIVVMFIFINKKEGFHEDEIFSYGSSNYMYDNVYQQFGKSDSINQFIGEKILDKNPIQMIKNFKYYYMDHTNEKDEYIKNLQDEARPIWRSSQEAKEYVTIDKNDIFNYVMVYYNQSRDVHPPIFYFLVHTISILFFGVFSKYIIFIINLAFFIASCFVIKAIMKAIGKDYLSNIAVLFYGLSMGAISTVLFQRMYMTLTFFVLSYLLINIVILKNNFEINRKTWIQLTLVTIFGFLTQYYFCIICVVISTIMFIGIKRTKGSKEGIKFILNYIKIALLGIILFPSSIDDIFFSYRGIGTLYAQTTFLTKLMQNISLLSYSFSIPLILALIGLIAFIVIEFYRIVKEKIKPNIYFVLILIVPTILYILIVSKISPYIEYRDMIRYIMCIIPIVAISIILLIDFVFKNKKYSFGFLILFTLLLSTFGLLRSEPKYLFKGYSKYIEISEKYKEDNFVFIGNTNFNQIQNVPEFMNYNESLILNEKQLDYLVNDETLKSKSEFILSIKKYLGDDTILKEVLEKSGFSNYELLLDDNGDVGCIIYKIAR